MAVLPVLPTCYSYSLFLASLAANQFVKNPPNTSLLLLLFWHLACKTSFVYMQQPSVHNMYSPYTGLGPAGTTTVMSVLRHSQSETLSRYTQEIIGLRKHSDLWLPVAVKTNIWILVDCAVQLHSVTKIEEKEKTENKLGLNRAQIS